MLGSMGAAFYRPLESTSCRHRPWQVAAAVAMGVGCGLLLMESPLGALGLVALFFLPVHLPAAICSALLTAGLAWSIEPAMGQLGGWLLSWELVRSGLAATYRFPLVAWLRMNNTLVAGGLLLALAQFIPTFVLTRRAVSALMRAYRESDTWIQAQRESSIYAPAVGAPMEALGTAASSETDTLQFNSIEPSIADDLSPEQIEDVAFLPEPPLSEMPLSEADDPSQIAALLEGDSLSSNQDFEPQKLSSEIDFVELSDTPLHTPPQESSFEEDVAEWVEEIEEQSEETEEPSKVFAFRDEDGTLAIESPTSKEAELDEKADHVERHIRVDAADLNAEGVAKRASELAALVDEMLEVIQSDQPVVAESNHETNSLMGTVESPTSNGQGGMPINSELHGKHLRVDDQHSAASSPSESKGGGQELVAAGANSSASADVSPTAVTFDEVAQHEEALRYLLHHLKEIKDKA